MFIYQILHLDEFDACGLHLYLLRLYEVIQDLDSVEPGPYDLTKTIKRVKTVSINLATVITKLMHQTCLVKEDLFIPVDQGGVIYLFSDSSIAGYSSYVYNNLSDIFYQREDSLLCRTLKVSF